MRCLNLDVQNDVVDFMMFDPCNDPCNVFFLIITLLV